MIEQACRMDSQDRTWFKLSVVDEVVPELLICEAVQVMVVVAVKVMVKALHIPRSHHGYKRRFEHLGLLYELILEDVRGVCFLQPATASSLLQAQLSCSH